MFFFLYLLITEKIRRPPRRQLNLFQVQFWWPLICDTSVLVSLLVPLSLFLCQGFSSVVAQSRFRALQGMIWFILGNIFLSFNKTHKTPTLKSQDKNPTLTSVHTLELSKFTSSSEDLEINVALWAPGNQCNSSSWLFKPNFSSI